MSYSNYYVQMAEAKNRAETKREWHADICEYYNVTPELALQLGTRSDGRKPSLPGSKTCEPVSDMTMEDIWALKPRETVSDIHDFYRDQGAWSAFRQTVRHLELAEMRKNVMSQLVSNGMHFVEYGCGIAPFTTTLLENMDPSWDVDVSLTDVDKCEHYLYGQWVLDRLKDRRSLERVNINAVPAVPDSLPKYHKKIDALVIFEVQEHLPSPVAALKNIMDQMNPKALIVENFVKHVHDHDEEDDPGCDLASAAEERDEYYRLLDEHFTLVAGTPEYEAPNATRIWVKKV